MAVDLAHRFFLVIPDLRCYGDSTKPPGGEQHFECSNAMGANMDELMA